MRDQIQLECLVRDLEKSFKEAWDIFVDYQYALMSKQGEGYYEEPLRDRIESIWIQLQFAYEALGLSDLRATLRAGFDAYRDRLTEVGIGAMGYPDSPALHYLGNYFRPLRASVPSAEEAERVAALQQLERILLGTPKLISDRNLEPKNENDVCRAMYDLLIHFYPDAVRDVPIAKQSKVYKPDIGIQSLKCAIEYKFADSEKELRVALGGIYEDIAGYAGSEDWKVFFAVIYMTEHFLMQTQVEAEFRISKVDRSWKPLLVVGKGARKKRSSQPPP